MRLRYLSVSLSGLALGAVTSMGSCKEPVCGDGAKNQSDDVEECDDGNDNDQDGCTSECKLATCGDGFVLQDEDGNNIEECDDGNLNDRDGCTTLCLLPRCGDGFVHDEGGDGGGGGDDDDDAGGDDDDSGPTGALEECDDGNFSENDACTNECKIAACGDGIVRQGVEACDDGNTDDGDQCSSICALPSCGNAVVDGGEECDDGNRDDSDACLSTCFTNKCGDGILLEGEEECDDGNTIDGDWCDESCEKECILGEKSWMTDGRCYMEFEEPQTWDDAHMSCQLVDSHLVSIQSGDENDDLSSKITQGSVWIGFTDQWSEGTFVWAEDQDEILAPTFDGWATGEPDNQPNDLADCALLDKSGKDWSDENCTDLNAYVCEHEWE